MKNRILLINAINPNVEVERRQSHLGLGYLASALRNHFGDIFFEFRIINRNVEKELKQFKPDIVFITSVTQNFDIAVNYAYLIKQGSNIPVIIGGIHITMMPYSFNHNFDIGVLGEGEEAIVEIMEVFLKKGNFTQVDLSCINGIIYKDGDDVHFTPKRTVIENLDSIGMPARDLLDIPRHAYMFTSRGCPYNCVFCASTRFWPNVRFFSAEYVMTEIRELVYKYNVELISFYDDLFVANRPRLKEIALLLRKDKGLKKVRFTCNCRVNLVNEEIILLLKEMNMRSINFGLESGCEKTLRYLKGNVSLEQNRKAIEMARNHGIACSGSFIIGSPSETEADIMETYNFIKSSRLNLIDIYVLTPYPGTPVWDYAKSKNIVSEHMKWSRLNIDFEHNIKDAIILSEVLTKDEIIRLLKRLLRLRFRKNVVGIFAHPYVKDLPKVAIRLLNEYLHRLFMTKSDVRK